MHMWTAVIGIVKIKICFIIFIHFVYNRDLLVKNYHCLVKPPIEQRYSSIIIKSVCQIDNNKAMALGFYDIITNISVILY